MGFISKKVRNSLEPKWNFSVPLQISKKDSKEVMEITVYDDDFGAENFIGSLVLPLSKLLAENDIGGVWYDLNECKSGHICISSSLETNDETKGVEGLTNEMHKKEVDKSKVNDKFIETPNKDADETSTSQNNNLSIQESNDKTKAMDQSLTKDLKCPNENDKEEPKKSPEEKSVNGKEGEELISSRRKSKDDLKDHEISSDYVVEDDISLHQKSVVLAEEEKDTKLDKLKETKEAEKDIEVPKTNGEQEQSKELSKPLIKESVNLPKTENSNMEDSREYKTDANIIDENDGSVPSVEKISDAVMPDSDKEQKEALLSESTIKDDSKFSQGVLEITIKRASQLVNNDKIGKSDPYVKVRYSDIEFRSHTIKNTLEPEWNFSCKFDILNLDEKYIHINVYDDDFGKDNIEGCYSLSVSDAMSGIPPEGCWYDLVGCKTGKVYVSTVFTPLNSIESPTKNKEQDEQDSNLYKNETSQNEPTDNESGFSVKKDDGNEEISSYPMQITEKEGNTNESSQIEMSITKTEVEADDESKIHSGKNDSNDIDSIKEKEAEVSVEKDNGNKESSSGPTQNAEKKGDTDEFSPKEMSALKTKIEADNESKIQSNEDHSNDMASIKEKEAGVSVEKDNVNKEISSGPTQDAEQKGDTDESSKK